jgi:transposase
MVSDQPTIEKKETKKKTKKKPIKNKHSNRKNNQNNQNKVLNSIHLRIYPNKKQKETIKNWLGASRFIYNKCLDFIKKNNSLAPKEKEKITIKLLRSKFVNESVYETENQWLLDVPYDVRDEAVRDLLNNYNSNFKKGVPFDIKFKHKKGKQSLNVLGKHWNVKVSNIKYNYGTVLTPEMKCERTLPSTLKHTSRLIKEFYNEYYLAIPTKKKHSREQRDNHESQVLSIDPGIRKFMVGYDPKGSIFEFGGNSDVDKLHDLFKRKCTLLSEIASKDINHRRRYRLKNRVLERISKRIQNMRSDMHRKAALWMCTNYNIILIPKLNLHDFKFMTRENRVKLSLWNHCKFVDLLVHKSKEFRNCNVHVVNEHYTSKTCNHCGQINRELGCSEVFTCTGCKNTYDRDHNGARGIYLKNHNHCL